MKQLLFLVVALFGLMLPTQSVQAANIDNFRIVDFAVDMKLSQDKDKRSVLKTTETIKANFLNKQTNHGLERAFVKDYNGHPTSFQLDSVTDDNGASLEYHWDGDSLRIGDANTYVYGMKTYNISYTQRDVTREYRDINTSEFYWDAIGLDWRVPIDRARVKLTIDPPLRDSIKTDINCYIGVRGSRQACDAEKQAEGTYIATTSDLARNNGMTIALGFTPNTFAPYQQSLFEKVRVFWIIAQSFVAIVMSFAVIVLLFRQYSKNNRKKEIGTIVPEYLPPKDTSVTTAGKIEMNTTTVGTAQLLDFAVRHYIKIYEVKEKSFWVPAEYEIEIVKDLSTLKAEEQEVLSDMFGSLPAVGQHLNLKTLKNNVKFTARVQDNRKKLKKLVRGQYGLKQEDARGKKELRNVAGIAALLAVPLVSPPLLIFALLVFILSFNEWRLTDKGLALKRYLYGLKMYITVAEEDRIKMLQSPEGAEKVAEVGDAGDIKNRLVLYERVLPYAILFGKEKQWNKQLGMYYESANTQPGWYSSRSGVFSAAAFSSGMTSFSTTATSSGASASSGGSTGGGSAGGGGGGGGGGGW